jgi:hypothetical protein
MGREARERKQRISARLAEIARRNGDSFCLQWEAKLKAYSDEIWHAARHSQRVRAFSLIEKAQRELAEFDKEIVAAYAGWTKAFLENEACRAPASVIGGQIYHINQKYDRRD